MKQRIDHNNYEAWLLDRLEGNLSAEQEQELATFLALHPELDPGDGELPTVTGHGHELRALDKDALKRTLPPVAQVDPLNVEDHLIARLENDLSMEQVQALRLFLVHHPEYERAERLYALTKLVPEAMAFLQKQAMVRDLPPHGMPTRFTLDDFLVARLEGGLSPAQEIALNTFLRADPTAERSWKLMQATRISSDGMTYPDKDELKKGGRVIAITSANWMVRLAAAASVAVLLGMSWWWWTRSDVPDAQVARNEQVIAPTNGSQQKAQVKDSVVPDMTPEEQGPTPKQEGRQQPPYDKREPVQPVPSMVPLEQDAPQPIAEHDPAPNDHRQVPVQPNVPAPVIPAHPEEALASATVEPVRNNQPAEVNTLGQTLAATLRERVLDAPGHDVRPLDGNDAVAVVDKGLKAVGGEHAGLAVARDGAGRSRGFNLRLGRNLSISASR